MTIPNQDEYDDDAIVRRPAFEKLEYTNIFETSGSYVGASTRMSFFALAQLSITLIVKRLADGQPPSDYEGTAALFFFRHYLELTLKTIVSNSRYLENTGKNAPVHTVIKVDPKHHLLPLWEEAKNKIPIKVGNGVLKQWDYAFVAKCIKEFHEVDPDSERLRYKSISKGDEPCSLAPVSVDWIALLRATQHTRDVLEDINSYLIEAHGLNADWEAELDSWQ